MREYEEKMATMERANFDLKMQVYHLSNKITEAPYDSTMTVDERFTVIIEERNQMQMKMRGENAELVAKVSELEKELVQYRVGSSIEELASTKLEAALSKCAHLEESLKADRLNRDALIESEPGKAALEAEVMRLREEGLADKELVNDCAVKVAALMKTMEGQSLRLSEYANLVMRLEDELEVTKKALDEASSKSILSGDNAHHIARIAELQKLHTDDKERFEAEKKALVQWTSSAEELTLMEIEEIARLESELEKARQEVVHWQSQTDSANAKTETAQGQLKALEQKARELDYTYGMDARVREQYSVLVEQGGLRDSAFDRYQAKLRELELMESLEGLINKYQRLEALHAKDQSKLERWRDFSSKSLQKELAHSSEKVISQLTAQTH